MSCVEFSVCPREKKNGSASSPPSNCTGARTRMAPARRPSRGPALHPNLLSLLGLNLSISIRMSQTTAIPPLPVPLQPLTYERRPCVGLLRPFLTLFHRFQEFHLFFLRFRCRIRGFLEKASHSCVCLVQSRHFSNSHSFNLGRASSNFLKSSFFPGLSSMICTSSPHCQCFAHSFLFVPQWSNSLASSSFLRIRASWADCFPVVCTTP